MGLIFWHEKFDIAEINKLRELSHASFPLFLVQLARQDMGNLNDPKDRDYEACLVPINVVCHWVKSL